MNIGFYTNEHGILHEKAKTTNNGSFLKLFKTLTARVLSNRNTAVRVLNITWFMICRL